MIEVLKERFHQNMTRHPDLTWECVENRLRDNARALEILERMEESGGEPDTIGFDHTGELIFCDCSKETPAGRRSLYRSEKRILLQEALFTRLRRQVLCF